MAVASAAPASAIDARGPAPTKAPATRGEPLHVLLTPAEIALRKRNARVQQERADAQRRQGDGVPGPQEHILGPFWARSQDDVRRAKLEWDAEQVKKRRARPATALNPRKDAIDVKGSHREDRARRRQDKSHPRSLGPVLSDDEWLRMRMASESSQRSSPDLDEVIADLARRQTEAEETCYVGNAQLSCFPTMGLQIPQGTWSKFIWNPYYPLFIQQGFVDVYLYREDQDRIQTSWTSQRNRAGRISFSPTDSWWQDRPRAQNIQEGQNISWPFYFVVNPSGLNTGGTTIRQSTWFAIQTALPSVIAASRSADAAASASAASVTVAAISASIASQLSAELQSSLNAQGLTGTQTLVGSFTTVLDDGQTVIMTATGKANGTLSGGDGANSAGSNSEDGGPNPPRWAIAVIVILGFLAIVFVASMVYLFMRKARRRSAAANAAAPGSTNRGSMGSGSPMMRHLGGPGAISSLDGAASPVGTHSNHALSASGGPDASIGFGSAALAAEAGAAGAASVGHLPAARSVRSSGDSHPFSSDEATRMADAFRNALRKPEFSAGGAFGGADAMESPREEDGDSPAADERSSPITGAVGDVGNQPASKVVPALLKQELASEGKDLRRVGERKKAQYHEEENVPAPGASAQDF